MLIHTLEHMACTKVRTHVDAHAHAHTTTHVHMSLCMLLFMSLHMSLCMSPHVSLDMSMHVHVGTSTSAKASSSLGMFSFMRKFCAVSMWSHESVLNAKCSCCSSGHFPSEGSSGNAGMAALHTWVSHKHTHVCRHVYRHVHRDTYGHDCRPAYRLA